MTDEMEVTNTEIQEDDEIVTLTYDDGTQENFYDIAELDYEGKWYIYLQPVDPGEEFEEDEVMIYEMAQEEEGQEVFLPVEDEELMDKLIEMLNKEIED